MNPKFDKMMQGLRAKDYDTFYVIDGEETYYTDIITQYFEDNILTEAEKDFNLIVLYGKDAEWTDVVNACRRFPMFAERQVVILKDAAQMKSLNELVPYLENPSPTTVFLIEHRFKKVDGRSKLATLIKKKGTSFTSDKLKDEEIPAWVQSYGKRANITINMPEAQTLASYLGNDLQKIVNEIEKVLINIPGENVLSAELIQKYIGISREYNVFEFPGSYTSGNGDKMVRMLNYFIANPKVAVMPVIVGAFTSHLSQLYEQHYNLQKGIKPKWMPGDVAKALQTFTLRQTEQAIMVVAEYSAKAVGINSSLDQTELLKEMMGRLAIVKAA